jgi:hypothetical protein
MERQYEEEFRRLQVYAIRRGAQLMERLGFGQDGLVYATNHESVLKCLRYERLYQTERNVYQRLARLDREEIAGFNVPKLLSFDDSLWIVEMQIVSPPFVLDFAGASLDQQSRVFAEMSDEDHQEWIDSRIEMYGDDWPRVETVLAEFRKQKIFLTDIKPGNITIRG